MGFIWHSLLASILPWCNHYVVQYQIFGATYCIKFWLYGLHDIILFYDFSPLFQNLALNAMQIGGKNIFILMFVNIRYVINSYIVSYPLYNKRIRKNKELIRKKRMLLGHEGGIKFKRNKTFTILYLINQCLISSWCQTPL